MWWKDKESAPPTLVLLARDSTVYFTVIFALMMANLLYFEYGPPSLVMIKPSNTAVCIAGSRMLLNIRALAYPNHTTDMEMSIYYYTSFFTAQAPQNETRCGRGDSNERTSRYIQAHTGGGTG